MKLKFIYIFSILLTILISCKQETKSETIKLEGTAFGTSFHIMYQGKTDYTKQVDSLFHLINKSLSTYIPNSDISKINNGDTTVIIDSYFKEVFNKSHIIFKETEGAFDPTIGTLVNAWGFGPKTIKQKPDSIAIKKLLKITGFEKVSIVNNKIKKINNSTYFDFNAIAKGYAVDIVGRFLEKMSIVNYLIEIGGEIRARGIKQNGSNWKAGIEDPNFDGSRTIQKVIVLKDEAMATSGSYRKFKIDSLTGQKYAHILNTKTGYPSKNNLLSVSVIGKVDCANTDAYATALMTMSLPKAKQFLKNHQELRAYIIYGDSLGNLKTYTTPNF